MRHKKKFFTFLLSVALLLLNGNSIYATTNNIPYSYFDATQILVDSGYTKETAEALSEDARIELAQAIISNPDSVSVDTTCMEVDMLEEIEVFYSYTDEDLIDAGADKEQVDIMRNQYNSYNRMSKGQLATTLGVSETEADFLKKAIEKGKDNLKNPNISAKKTGVKASGTISSATMTYTQSGKSLTTSIPQYKITISYSWKAPYALSIFKDSIVIAWGCGLNFKEDCATIKYYKANKVDSLSYWGSYYKKRIIPSRIVSSNASIAFDFPQAYGYSKTKEGSAEVVLYQKQTQNLDTYVYSNYCHKILAVGTGISVAKSGSSVSLSIGYMYDKTPQKRSLLEV